MAVRTAGMGAMTDPYTERLGAAVDGLLATQETVLAERDAQIERWRKHSENWENTARNTATALMGACEVLKDVEGMGEAELSAYRETFRNQCLSNGLTP